MALPDVLNAAGRTEAPGRTLRELSAAMFPRAAADTLTALGEIMRGPRFGLGPSFRDVLSGCGMAPSGFPSLSPLLRLFAERNAKLFSTPALGRAFAACEPSVSFGPVCDEIQRRQAADRELVLRAFSLGAT